MKLLDKYVYPSSFYKRIKSTLERTYIGNKSTNLYRILTILAAKLGRDDIDQRANAVAFNLTLSIFPAIIFLFTLIPYIPIPHLDKQIMDFLSDVLPKGIYRDAAATIQDIISRPRGNLLSLGFVLALYAATNGMVALMTAFNRTYRTTENRTFIKKRLVAVVLTFALAFVLFLSILLLIVGEIVLDWIVTESLINEDFTYYLILILRYIIVFLSFFGMVSFIYYLAPSIHKRWRFFSLGSIVASSLGIIITQLFSYYFSNFASYNKLYGSIGTIIAFMIWIYLISIIILLGFELNASVDEAKKTA
ncbi:MAG: YihY/virulence factor BrkB family protein [Bacteroidota bacterium]